MPNQSPAVVVVKGNGGGGGNTQLLLGLVIIGAMGVGAYYLLLKPSEEKKQKNEFRSLSATYDKTGTKIPKALGATFAVNLAFEHRGPGGEFDIGIGIAPVGVLGLSKPVTHWFLATATIPDDADWEVYPEVEITGIIPSDMAPGLKDVLLWIQAAGGKRDPNGRGFLEADWDQDVYEVLKAGTEFRNLEAIYESATAAIGDIFNCLLSFEYQGSGGAFDFGIGFAPAGFLGLTRQVTHWFTSSDPLSVLPPASSWKRIQLAIFGTIPKDMALGLKDILTWIQVDGGKRNADGSGFVLADWDQDVYDIKTAVTTVPVTFYFSLENVPAPWTAWVARWQPTGGQAEEQWHLFTERATFTTTTLTGELGYWLYNADTGQFSSLVGWALPVRSGDVLVYNVGVGAFA